MASDSVMDERTLRDEWGFDGFKVAVIGGFFRSGRKRKAANAMK